MKFEYVYILTNPAMPDWVKVGKSNNVLRRINDLNCTAVPLPFECFACLKVPADNVMNVERGLQTFLGYSFQKEKEFFRTSPDRVLKYFETAQLLNPAYEIIKGEDLEDESQTETEKSAATTFALLDLPVGSKLVYTKDSNVVCEVADKSNHVIYEGQKYTISGLAVKLCGYNVNGYTRFMFEDETLWKRRQRLHPEL
jgi:hypothetical protein